MLPLLIAVAWWGVAGEATAQPVIASVTPTPVTYGVTISQSITIAGSGFVDGATVTIDSPSTTTVLAGTAVATAGVTQATSTNRFVFVSAQQVEFFWQRLSLAVGDYDVIITNPVTGESSTRPAAFTVARPQPAVTAVSPTALTYYFSPDTALTISGNQFVAGSTVTIAPTPPSPSPIPTTVLSGTVGTPVLGKVADQTTPFVMNSNTTLSVYWPNTSLSPATYTITVTSPAAAGSLSGSLADGLTIAAPQPTVTSARPTPVEYGVTPSQAIMIGGSQFVPGARITFFNAANTVVLTGLTQVGGIADETNRFVWLDPTTVSVWWPNDLLRVGVYLVAVRNPPAAGNKRGDLPAGFEVKAPQPSISGVSPLEVQYGVTFSRGVAISGSKFVAGATITISGPGLPTPMTGTTVAGFGADASTPFVWENTDRLNWWWANDSLPVGDYSIHVQNPAAAGGGQTPVDGVFRVTSPKPVISTINPSSVTYGVTTSRAITIGGSGFVAGATVTILSPATSTPLSGRTIAGFEADETNRFVWTSNNHLSVWWGNSSLNVATGATSTDYSIQVRNPPRAGGLQADQPGTLSVQAAVPTITSVVPTFDRGGVTWDQSPSQFVTITGTNFAVGAVIRIGTLNAAGQCQLPTCLRGSTVNAETAQPTDQFLFYDQRTVAFLWDDDAPQHSLAVGSYNVRVRNPAAAGGTFVDVADGFIVKGPVPVIRRPLVPSSVEYGVTPGGTVTIHVAGLYEPRGQDRPLLEFVKQAEGSTQPAVPRVTYPLDSPLPCYLPADAPSTTPHCRYLFDPSVDTAPRLEFLRYARTMQPGTYTVQVTNPQYAGTASGKLENGFTVIAFQPVITKVSPSVVTAGITSSREVTVTGSGFASSVGVRNPPPVPKYPMLRIGDPDSAGVCALPLCLEGQTVPGLSATATQPFVFVGPTAVKFYWPNTSLDPDRSYAVTVINPPSRGGLSGTKPAGFRVTRYPAIITVGPAGGIGAGARRAEVILTTAGFSSGATVAIEPDGSSDPLGTAPIVLKTAFRMNAAEDGGSFLIDVSETAAPGERSVVLTSAGGAVSFRCPDSAGTDTCKAGLVINPAPVITSVTPSLGAGASGRTLAITGDRFVMKAVPTDIETAVLFPTGVTGTCTVTSPTAIACSDVAIAADLGAGGYAVTVVNPDGGRKTATLAINAPPRFVSISPNHGAPGSTTVVEIAGANFQSGMAVAPGSGVGITVTSATATTATAISASLRIDLTAAAGYRSLILTNPDGGSITVNDAFYVGTPPPDTLSAIATYGQQSVSAVQYRPWRRDAWSGPYSGPALSSPPVWQVMKANPTRDERILAVVDEQRRLTLHVWDGQSWGGRLNAAASLGLARPSQAVDVAFEQTSGRGVVVYARTDSTTLRYRTWNGTVWSDEAMVDDAVNGQLTTGRPLWVRLEARPGTNDLLLVYEDDNDDLAAVVWNGASWESSMLLTTAGAGHQSPVFDVAFERLTGRAMAAWADASVPGSLRYRLWNAGWGAAATAATMSADPITVLRLGGDHGSNRIAAGVGTGASGLEALVWSGSGWSAVSPLTSSLVRAGDGRAFDLAWEGLSGELMAAYGTTTAPRGAFRVWSASGWSGEAAVPVPTGGSAPGTPAWIELASARGEDQFAFSLLDIAGRITLARWNGAAWSGGIEAASAGSGVLSGVAGSAVAVSLAQHLAGPAPGITPPPSTTDTTPPATPVLTAGTVSSTSADLSWTAVGDNGATGGGRVARYELRRTLGAVVTTSTITAAQDPGGTENYTVLTLSGGKTYLLDVRAVDAAGNASPWSNRVSVATPAVPPTAITDLAIVKESPTQDAIYRNSVMIRWSRPPLNPDSAGLAYYIVKYKTGGAFASEQEFDAYQPALHVTGETVTIDSLAFNTTYWFAVKTVDLAGNTSARSNALQATTADHPPAAVTDLRSIGSTTSSITLRWTMPADDSGPIASYIVKYTKLTTVGAITSNAEFNLGPPGVVTATNLPTRDTALQPYVETLVVSPLDSNTTYWFSVKAVDPGGKPVPLSNSPEVMTIAQPPDTTAPAPITNLTVVSAATTSRSLQVSWTATGDDGSVGTATKYDVRYARFELNAATFTQGTAISAPLPGTAGAPEQLTLPALISNTQYFVGVKAIDEAGNASLSNIAVGLTGLRRGYTLVSVPVLLSAPNDDVLSVFADDVGSTLSLYRWRSQGRNSDQGCYDGFPSPYSPYPGFSCGTIQAIAAGRGYFLYNAEESTGGRAVLDAVGTVVTTSTAEVPLSEGFNMVGNPYQREIHLRDVRVKNLALSSEVSYQQAIDAGWVAPALLLFDGVVTQAYGVTDLQAVFKPWNGVWIQSFFSDVILVFTRP